MHCGSLTNKQAPATSDGSKTAAADTKACAEIETQDTAGAGSRAAGSGGNTSETALPGAHGALKAEMAAKHIQVDAYEAIWEAGKLAAQRDASKAALNALDDADPQYSVDAVRNASDAWRAAANAAAHAKSVAKDKTEAAEQAHKKATYEAAKHKKRIAKEATEQQAKVVRQAEKEAAQATITVVGDAEKATKLNKKDASKAAANAVKVKKKKEAKAAKGWPTGWPQVADK